MNTDTRRGEVTFNNYYVEDDEFYPEIRRHVRQFYKKCVCSRADNSASKDRMFFINLLIAE